MMMMMMMMMRLIQDLDQAETYKYLEWRREKGSNTTK